MSELVANCPRCNAVHVTFDLSNQIITGTQYNWQNWYEAFCVCRHCRRSTIFILSEKGVNESDVLSKTSLSKLSVNVNNLVRIEGYISAKDKLPVVSPEHMPNDVQKAFEEGAKCLSIGCINAASTMFRLCIDLSTKSMLPQSEQTSLNARTRRDLGLRLPWLFDNSILPEALRELSICIKEDGNDGAHKGTLSELEAQDILDFTVVLLERIYTEPARLKEAKARRDARRTT